MAIIGIDLGTTNSLAAVWSNNESKIIPNATGSHLTPSIVSVTDDDTVLIGEAAKERLITKPEDTASCFKRTMGQAYFYKLHGKTFTSTELSALVLKSLKQDAEKYLGEEVTEAVISVPAYFNQNQRKATKDAAELAGLKVERLISEPTAAALCYGLQNRDDMSTVLIFDLGGGTFDVSLLEFFEGVVDVKAVSGDNRLGGEDYTKAIVAWFLTTNNLDVSDLSADEMAKLVKTCEIAKRSVSNPESSLYQISIKIKGKDYLSVLTYQTFCTITQDLQDRLLIPIKKVLRDAGLTREDVDAVVLMGGSTRMKNVIDFVHEVFGEKVISSFNPDETVALGAGVLAAMKSHNVELKETVLTDICPFSLGIEVANHNVSNVNGDKGLFSPIIERNSPIPISIQKEYISGYIGQEYVEINIYQGESLNVSEDLNLGKLEVTLPVSKTYEVVLVRFTYDINGLLEVEATTSDGKKTSLLLNNTNSEMSELELKQAQANMENLKILPWEKQENIVVLERGKRLFEESVGELRDVITSMLRNFEEVLGKQNPDEINRCRKRLNDFFNKLEQDW